MTCAAFQDHATVCQGAHKSVVLQFSNKHCIVIYVQLDIQSGGSHVCLAPLILPSQTVPDSSHSMLLPLKCPRKNGRDIHGDNNDFLAERMAEISMAAKTASFTASSVRCESKGFNHQSIGKIKNIRFNNEKDFNGMGGGWWVYK